MQPRNYLQVKILSLPVDSNEPKPSGGGPAIPKVPVDDWSPVLGGAQPSTIRHYVAQSQSFSTRALQPDDVHQDVLVWRRCSIRAPGNLCPPL